MVVEKVKCLGFEMDDERNGAELEGKVMELGAEGARCRTLVCATDEQVSFSFFLGFGRRRLRRMLLCVLTFFFLGQFEMARGCAEEARNFKKGQQR